MTWIFHGDVFDNTTKGGARVLAKLGSSGYNLLIRFNRLVNFILKALGRERVSISKRVMAGVNKAVSKTNDFELIAAELAIEKKYDYVICGHIHQPQKKLVSTKDGSVTHPFLSNFFFPSESRFALNYRQEAPGDRGRTRSHDQRHLCDSPSEQAPGAEFVFSHIKNLNRKFREKGIARSY